MTEPSWLDKATHRRVAVHTVEDQTFEGVLALAAEDGLLLWNVQVPNPDNPDNPMTLDGEVFIPRDKVHFLQTVRM